jgi:hypothetical protein
VAAGGVEAAGVDAAFKAAARAAAAASFSRSISCFDLTDGMTTFAGKASPVPVSSVGATGVSEAVAVATGASAAFFAANSSRSADALMLSTVLDTDFTSWATIRRSFKSAIISLLSKPSSSASL